MNLFETLKSINKSIHTFDKVEIKAADKNLGWIHTVRLEDGVAFAGGIAKDESTSLRIAIAEAYERSLFINLSKNNAKNLFLKDYPTTCGFAAGFDSDSTRFRSICEAVERWIWSKWIDENYILNEIKINDDSLTELGRFFKRQFIEYKAFQKEISISVSEFEKLDLVCSIFLGLTDRGVFAGSRVTTCRDEQWEHTFVEAYRNLNNFKYFTNKSEKVNQENIISVRGNFFAQNRDLAFAQILLAQKKAWPEFKVKLLKDINTNIKGVYLWRCLADNYRSWHEGDKSRFVY